jgi:hypothetical protein
MSCRTPSALLVGLLALGLAGFGLALAQQPPARDDAQDAAPTTAAAPPAAAQAPDPASPAPASSEPAAPAKPAAAKGTPQRFEPTEKVRPDFDVAFPVDI